MDTAGMREVCAYYAAATTAAFDEVGQRAEAVDAVVAGRPVGMLRDDELGALDQALAELRNARSWATSCQSTLDACTRSLAELTAYDSAVEEAHNTNPA